MTKPELQRRIKLILKHKNVDKPENAGAKEGLMKAAEILESGQQDLRGVEELSCDQARAIAMLAVDFNNMKESGKFFIKFGEAITGIKKTK